MGGCELDSSGSGKEPVREILVKKIAFHKVENFLEQLIKSWFLKHVSAPGCRLI